MAAAMCASNHHPRVFFRLQSSKTRPALACDSERVLEAIHIRCTANPLERTLFVKGLTDRRCITPDAGVVQSCGDRVQRDRAVHGVTGSIRRGLV